MRLVVFLSFQNHYTDAALLSRGPDWELLPTPEDPDSAYEVGGTVRGPRDWGHG